MTPLSRRHLLAAAAVAAAPWARAQGAYPAKPLNWIVPYPTGGFGDGVSRLLGQKLADSLKTPVLVENKPGAGGQIGVLYAKQQPADGYTLLYGDIGPFAMNAALYPKLGYDMLKDFTPVTRLLTSPSVLVVPASSPCNSFADLVKAAQGKPLNYGSYGVGSAPHIWGEMLTRETGGHFNHAPYKGAAPALQDLIGGHLDLLCDVVASSLPLVRDGKIKALALIGSEQRLPQLPNVPTLTELGHPKLQLLGWTGVAVRAGTPPAIVQRLHDELAKAVQSPEVQQRYLPMGLGISPQSPQEFAQFIAAETARWSAVIKQAGITIE